MRWKVAVLLVGLLCAAAAPAEEVSILPDPTLTPGAVDPVDEAAVCGTVGGLTYEKRSRAALTARVKRAITRTYGQDPEEDGDHELDHRVPAALAGKSDASNVWWQPGEGHGTLWTYQLKDRLDTLVWRKVCREHSMTLAAGQAVFLEADWREPYCRIIGGDPCPP